MSRKERRRRKLAKKSPGGGGGALLQEAVALHQAGRLEEAEAAYLKTLDAHPGLVDAHYNFGVLLRELGRLDEAADAYQGAIQCDPENFGAHVNLGVARQEQDRLDEARTSYERALEINPDFAEVHLNLGIVGERLGELDGAVQSFRRALDLKPDYVEAHNGLAVALQKQGNPDEAVASFERALEIEPAFAEAHNNLGNLHHRLGEMDRSMAAFRRALEIDPAYAEAHRNYAQVLLLAGRFEEGWAESQWRWKCRDFPSERRNFPQTPWHGEALDGKTVLVWGEQGVGDEIHFAEMVPDLTARGARVVLESDPRLVPLFGRSFAGVRCIARTTPPAPEAMAPDIDFQAPMGNLGRWLRPGLDAFPGRPSYLIADPDRLAQLRRRYRAGGDDLLVGISWVSKNPEIGREKSLSLTDWRPLAETPGVRFIDLQYGDTAADRAAFEAETGKSVFHDDEVDQMADLDAFAAQVAAMDLVVTVSNTTAHLGGALGVPTWVLLNKVPLCVWMEEGDRSPWYPSARLFRQTEAGRWADAIGRAARELADFAPS